MCLSYPYVGPNSHAGQIVRVTCGSLRDRGQPLHEAYTHYGSSRVSCAFCVLSSASDLAASSRCEANHGVYRQLVDLEIESSFSFQPNRWLGDIAPHLLSHEQRIALKRGKEGAKLRQEWEGQIPPELLLRDGRAQRLPTEAEAEVLADVRRKVGARFGIPVLYTSAAGVRARYELLLPGR